MNDQIQEAVDYLRGKKILQPEIGVILGTGLGHLFVKEIGNKITINYNSIPHFPISTVEYHKGKLIYGELKGKKVLAMQGPVVVDVHVIPDEVRAPRLQSYQRPDGSFVSKPLEDMFPFLSREEFLENMIVKPLPE